jgi:uncharacterized protein YyaL (SSP411 family)
LYETCFVGRYIDEAVQLAEAVLKHFPDREHGGFFYTADDHEELIARQKDIQDSPLPSGNGMIAHALVRLGKLTGSDDFLRAAESTLSAMAAYTARIPSATGQTLLALDLYLGPMYEIVLVGDGRQKDTQDVLADLRRRYLPRRVLAFRDAATAASPALGELLSDKKSIDGKPTAYVCRNFACQAPLVGREEILTGWQRMAK